MGDYAHACERFRWQVPETFNFGTDVIDALANDERRLALIWCDEFGAEARFTFADISRASNRLASTLANHGVTKGDRVIIMLPRRPQWQIAMIACLKLGAVVVPCITMLTARDLTYRLAHSGARVVITTGESAAKVPQSAALTVTIAVGGAAGWLDWDDALESGSPDSDGSRRGTMAAHDATWPAWR